MSTNARIPLQPLRIPIGWLVEWNTFSEAEASFSTYDDLSWEFSEDMLLLTHRGAHVAIDLGWRPGHRADGAFVLTAARMRGDSTDWDNPLKQLRSRSKEQVVKVLEDWLQGGITTGGEGEGDPSSEKQEK